MDQGIQTEKIPQEPQTMKVSGSINIKDKTKPTSLIKRTKEQLINCKPPLDKRFELHWDYTTNKSGTQEFTFTGKEMGENFWSPEKKNSLNIGDLVIFKNAGHQNNGYKARIYAKTGLIKRLEALKKGIIDELPNVPDEYDLRFIAAPTINGKRIEKEKGVSKDKIQKIPGYRFFFCGKGKKNTKKTNLTDDDYIYNKGTLKGLIKLEMRKGFVKKLPWKIEMVEARYTDQKKDKDGKDIPPEKLIDTPEGLNFQIAGVDLIEISNPVCVNADDKKKELHKIRAKVHLRLVKIEKGKVVMDADAAMSVLDCKEHKRRIGVLMDKMRGDFAKQAESFTELIGDKLNQRYAKNQYGEMEWYQNKGKKEHLAHIKREKYRKEQQEKKRKEISGEPEESQPTASDKARDKIKQWKDEGKADAHYEDTQIRKGQEMVKKIEAELKEDERKKRQAATTIQKAVKKNVLKKDGEEYKEADGNMEGGKRKMSRKKKNKKRSCTKKNRRNKNK